MRVRHPPLTLLTRYRTKFRGFLGEASTHAKVIFGRNILPYQEALDAGTTIGTITFTPVDHHFIFTDLGLSTSTVAAAATVTLSPWDGVVKISGAHTISTITPTWAGHRVTFIVSNWEG